MIRSAWLIVALLTTAAAPKAEPCRLEDLRLNQLQYIGTHNSYHLAPDPAVSVLMLETGYAENPKWPASRLVPALNYDHAPLTVQLRYGVRSIELDVYSDPAGGRFARPGALAAIAARGRQPVFPQLVPRSLERPGFKVLHMPDLDYRSTCATFVACLAEIRAWSDETPGHLPLIIMVEPKEHTKPSLDTTAYAPARVDRLEGEDWTRLESEILSVFPRERLITPSLVRGDAPSLRAAVAKRGWPAAGEVLRRILFVLGDDPEAVARYQAALGRRRDGLFFFDDGRGGPDSAWLYRPDPTAPDIAAAVRDGLFVYTRADAHGRQDPRLRDRALEAAQLVSTDFPWPDKRRSDYHAAFAGGRFVRAAPRSGACHRTAVDFERRD